MLLNHVTITVKHLLVKGLGLKEKPVGWFALIFLQVTCKLWCEKERLGIQNIDAPEPKHSLFNVNKKY